MRMRLGDDGTLDTLIVCSDCKAEFRYNYDPVHGREDATDDADDNYDSFVAWALEDAEGAHDCFKEG